MPRSRFQQFIEFVIDNLFDIATIAIAALVVIRYEIRTPTQTDVPEITTWILAVLGLIAVSGLWDRNRRLHRIEKLAEESRDLASRHLSGRVRASDFFRTNRDLPEQAFASTNEIYLSGMTLSRTSREYMHILSQRLMAGAHIRIMIADPSIDVVLRDLALRDGDLTAEEYRTRLHAVQALIKVIAETPASTGRVEVGYLPSAPAFGFVMLDPDQPHGICSVELYHHRSTEPTAIFELRATDDPHWYKFFRQQYELLWSTCRVETLPDGAEPSG